MAGSSCSTGRRSTASPSSRRAAPIRPRPTARGKPNLPEAPGPGRPDSGTPRRIVIVTDAWLPQVNGVVRTLSTVQRELAALGCAVEVIGPDRFTTLPCPTYPDIRLSLLPGQRLAGLLDAFRPEALHVATEGPLGLAAIRIARRRGWQFTTAFHTRFPEYVHARTRLPLAISYAWLRRFHGAGSGMMVATRSMRDELHGRGFRNLRPWSRGVDLDLFRPEPRDPWPDLPRPVFATIGRVAVEKNLRAFLTLELPGSKVVVGDGPMLPALKREFSTVHFTGARHGAALARSFAGADVFVFPSRTDTFGLVLLESLACGTPVAAYPVTGPKDVLMPGGPSIGAVDEELGVAALAALAHGDRTACRAYAESFSWRACAETFLSNLVPLKKHSEVRPGALPLDPTKA